MKKMRVNGIFLLWLHSCSALPETCSIQRPYKWSISASVICTISTVAGTMHLKSEYHPRKKKKNTDDESLQQCTVGREGRQEEVGEREGDGAASHAYSSSVFGASAGCLCFMSFSPLSVSSLPLCCFPFSALPSLFLPHPLLIPPCPVSLPLPGV